MQDFLEDTDALDAHGFKVGHVRLEGGCPDGGFLDDACEEVLCVICAMFAGSGVQTDAEAGSAGFDSLC